MDAMLIAKKRLGLSQVFDAIHPINLSHQTQINALRDDL